jgi:hypothetical protein
VLWTGPRFFTTMQIPMTRGREIGDGDRAGTPPVAVVSERFAKLNFGDADPIGRYVRSARVSSSEPPTHRGWSKSQTSKQQVGEVHRGAVKFASRLVVFCGSATFTRP